MSNDLCSPADLAYLPGNPFSEAEVDAAVTALQGAFGWHIAPEEEVTQQFTVQPMTRVLYLPTKHLVSVDAVRVDGVTLAATDYGVVQDVAKVVKISGWWPTGYDNIEVDYTHGFEECPKDMLMVIAEAAAIGRRDQAIQPYRLAFDQYEEGLPRRYSLRYIPGMS